MIKVDPQGDLIIRLYQRTFGGETFVGGSDETVSGRILATFRVSRQVLSDNSSYFKTLLRGAFHEAGQSVVDVRDGTINSLELVFRVIHDKMTIEMYWIPVADVWEVVEVCNYRHVDIKKFKTWFDKWIRNKQPSSLDTEDMRMLLYPCHEFDQAVYFAHFTKELVYRIPRHITERNPTDHDHHHLRPRVIGRLEHSLVKALEN
jgi:hypothetical protein